MNLSWRSDPSNELVSFKLRVHCEMKEETVYAIVVTKNGPKLQGTDECADKPTSFFDPSSCHTMTLQLVKSSINNP